MKFKSIYEYAEKTCKKKAPQVTEEHKKIMCELSSRGFSASQISKSFKDFYGIEYKQATVSKWITAGQK